MKRELSSVDIRILVRELEGRVVGCGIDKVYQVGERELVIKLFGKGSADIVVAPNFICETKYKRPAPQTPSSFAMQLRKRLGGAYVRALAQHGFDRIIEMRFDEHVLIFELFSKGNVLLCNKDLKILGLLDWQKWKDRTLGVGKTYEFPPPAADPFSFDEESFKASFLSSDRGVAATLATRFSLGGYYAELVSGRAGVDPKALCSGVDVHVVWSAFSDFLKGVDGPYDVRLTADNVSPFGGEGEALSTFNEAVDEYFSRFESSKASAVRDTKADERRQKILEVLHKQEAAYERANALSHDERLKGDLIYQRMGDIQVVFAHVREARKAGKSDEEIVAALESWGLVKGLKGFTLDLEI